MFSSTVLAFVTGLLSKIWVRDICDVRPVDESLGIGGGGSGGRFSWKETPIRTCSIRTSLQGRKPSRGRHGLTIFLDPFLHEPHPVLLLQLQELLLVVAQLVDARRGRLRTGSFGLALGGMLLGAARLRLRRRVVLGEVSLAREDIRAGSRAQKGRGEGGEGNDRRHVRAGGTFAGCVEPDCMLPELIVCGTGRATKARCRLMMGGTDLEELDVDGDGT